MKDYIADYTLVCVQLSRMYRFKMVIDTDRTTFNEK